MKSEWYCFIDDYEKQIPYKPISVLLEAFYWYLQIGTTNDYIFKTSAKDKVYELMMK
jgi:hypothetical protein